MPRRARGKPRVSTTQRVPSAAPLDDDSDELMMPVEASVRAAPAPRPTGQPRLARVAYGGSRESAAPTDYSYAIRDTIRIAILGAILVAGMVAFSFVMPQ